MIFAGIFLSGGLEAPTPTWNGFLLCIAAGCVFGGAYAVWTYGVQKGSMTVLAIGSYFTPVLSCLLGALMLGATLTLVFWQGVALVVIGSFICWLATREETTSPTAVRSASAAALRPIKDPQRLCT